MNILLIEDEHNVASFITKGLEEEGMKVTVSHNGEEGLGLALKGKYDLIILDLILPGLDGLDVCKNLREEKGNETPVIMLTALDSTENIVAGLNTGADDYLPKPFKFQELLARIQAITRRVQKNSNHRVLTFEDLSLNLDTKVVERAGKIIKLTAREFTLLEYFMRNPQKVLSRLEIFQHVWEVNFDLGTNIIDVYVNYLRNKVDKGFPIRLIHTVVGMGYVMKKD
ncbi:MAG: response regulator transcription factor [Cyclobacteriaceae bacterium]|nr:response regulator transcription factor [Cyclobacteriaceae bacterium]